MIDLNTPLLAAILVDQDIVDVVQRQAFELPTQCEWTVIRHRWQGRPEYTGIL